MTSEPYTEPTQRDLEYHGKAHGADGRDKVRHSLLGGLHTDSGDDSGGVGVNSPLLGDLIVGLGSPVKWGRYGLIVPAAAVRNALTVDNGETVPTWQETLDAVAPTTIAEADAPAAGTSLIYSHRDHVHGSPATYKPTAHNLLDGDRHGDTVAQGPTRGSLIYANATPKWDELVKPASPAVLYSDATDVAWDTLAWTNVTFTAGDYTASTGNWTLQAGDLGMFRYRLVGKTMFINFQLNATTVSATPAQLRILIPGGKTAAANAVGWLKALDNLVEIPNATMVASGGSTQLLLFPTFLTLLGGATAWAVSTNQTYVAGGIVLETT